MPELPVESLSELLDESPSGVASVGSANAENGIILTIIISANKIANNLLLVFMMCAFLCSNFFCSNIFVPAPAGYHSSSSVTTIPINSYVLIIQHIGI